MINENIFHTLYYYNNSKIKIVIMKSIWAFEKFSIESNRIKAVEIKSIFNIAIIIY